MAALLHAKAPLLHNARCSLQGMRLARQVGGLVHADRDSGSPISWHGRVPTPQPLTGQVAWVVGGAGIIGRGICKGLLNAGATVIVNSGSQARLDQLLVEFGNPERLVGIFGSMRNATCAQALVQNGMDMTNGRLNHVVAHCGVRWFSSSQLSAGTGDNNLWPHSPTSSSLHQDPEEFVERASLLPTLHMAAAQQLLQHLQHNKSDGSYTFVTGVGGDVRNIEAQVNAYAVWGLAAALREQYASSPVRVAELRVSLRVDRPAVERVADPRHTPLSRDIGDICAGIAASSCETSRGLHCLSNVEDIEPLKNRFPCPEFKQ